MSERERTKASERKSLLEAKMPALEVAVAGAEAEAAKAEEAVAVAAVPAEEDEAKRRAAAERFAKANADLAAAVAADQAAKRREARRALPVSVFISRASQRLYIRQGYEPILDVPVEFQQAEQPIGTHVFTAHDYKGDKTRMNWTVASIPYSAPAKTAPLKGRERRDAKALSVPAPAAVSPALQTAAAALERITIPEDLREQIADVMKPGSSLIISDNKLSGETGKYTDFIVSLR
jgi:hypothetical protein